MKWKVHFIGACMFVLYLGTSMLASAPAFAQANGCPEIRCTNCPAMRILLRPATPQQPAEQQAAATTAPSWGDWSLSVQGFGLWTRGQGGPFLYGIEGVFSGYLRMFESTYFTVQAGPGVGWVGGNAHPGLSEFVGAQYRFQSRWAVALGGRHRVVFSREGDDVNSLLGEAQITIPLGDKVNLRVSGGLGGAWYPLTEEVGVHAAGTPPIMQTKTEGGLTANAQVGVEVKF